MNALNREIARADIVVVGAGIMGLIAARNLARAGKRVIVLDRGRVMAEASGVNAGSLGVQNKLIGLVPYALEALSRWKSMSQELGRDVGFRNAGGWRVATAEGDRDILRKTASAQENAGISIEWHEHNSLTMAAPFLGREVICATHSPQDSYANPLLFARTLRDSALLCGVEIRENTAVTTLEQRAGWRVTTPDGVIRSEQVLITAGAWSGRLLAMVGVDLPLALDVNMISVTEPGARFIEGIVFHARGILTVKQIANGTCLIGGGWQGVGTLDDGRKEIDYESALHNMRLATSVLPELRHLNIVRQWSGFEGVTPDSLPYLGEIEDHAGLYICACVRGGWTLGPLFGALAGELLLRGRPTLPIEAFAPSRHAGVNRSLIDA